MGHLSLERLSQLLKLGRFLLGSMPRRPFMYHLSRPPRDPSSITVFLLLSMSQCGLHQRKASYGLNLKTRWRLQTCHPSRPEQRRRVSSELIAWELALIHQCRTQAHPMQRPMVTARSRQRSTVHLVQPRSSLSRWSSLARNSRRLLSCLAPGSRSKRLSPSEFSFNTTARLQDTDRVVITGILLLCRRTALIVDTSLPIRCCHFCVEKKILRARRPLTKLPRDKEACCSVGETIRAPRWALHSAKLVLMLLMRRLSTLTDELRSLQPSHRGACLEAVAAISER